MTVSVMTKDEVKDMCRRLKDVGCRVRVDAQAGTAEATDGGVVVYMALEKGKGGLWICRYSDGGRVRWSNPCLTRQRAEECGYEHEETKGGGSCQRGNTSDQSSNDQSTEDLITPPSW